MAVGMSHVHFPHVPRHVRRWPGHLDALLIALFINGIHVLDPPTHPAPFVLRLVLETREGARVLPFPASPLPAATHEDLARTGANGAESRGSPHRHNSFQPSLANQAKLASMSDTLRIGVTS